MMTPFTDCMRNSDARKISESFHWHQRSFRVCFTGNRKKQRADSTLRQQLAQQNPPRVGTMRLFPMDLIPLTSDRSGD